MTTDGTQPESRPSPAWKIALVVLPTFLVLSTAVALWLSWKKMEDPAPDPRLALSASAVRAAELDDHLRKLSVLLGRRDWESAAGRKNMRRAHTFIESTLSPQNYGFAPQTGEYLSHEGEIWPTVWADLKGTESGGRVVLVPAAYDLSDAAVAVVLAAANDLRDEEFRLTVRFVFYPAALYAAGEGKDLTDALRPGESSAGVVRPDLPAASGAPPEPGSWTGAYLKPVAEELAAKVRELAR